MRRAVGGYLKNQWLQHRFITGCRDSRWGGEIRPGNHSRGEAVGLPVDLNIASDIAGKLLRFMDRHLTGRRFLALDQPTLADLACYAYIAHA